MEEAHMNNGGYDLEGVIWHQHSNKLMVKILEYFTKDVPVIDLGCGHNFYVSVLNYAGYSAFGFDQAYMGSMHSAVKDITIPIHSSTKKNVISLEVGEHIPKELTEGYLNNVAGFKGDVIMSWALPGQAGVGHINCQPNSWVITEMANRGFKLDQEKTNSLREAVNGCHCSWFKNTLMYFTCV
jgi:hypothetical protein